MFSKANEDIVVKEPQNPIAIRREYLVSKFHTTDKIENMPKIKLPVTLTVKTLIGSIPNVVGKDTILYLRKTPDKAPIDRNTNSIPFCTGANSRKVWPD